MSLFKAFPLKPCSVLDANIRPYRQDPTESSDDFALDGVEHILEPGQGTGVTATWTKMDQNGPKWTKHLFTDCTSVYNPVSSCFQSTVSPLSWSMPKPLPPRRYLWFACTSAPHSLPWCLMMPHDTNDWVKRTSSCHWSIQASVWSAWGIVECFPDLTYRSGRGSLWTSCHAWLGSCPGQVGHQSTTNSATLRSWYVLAFVRIGRGKHLQCATPFEACLLFPGVCTTKLAMWVHDSNFHFVPPWLFAFSTPPPLFPTTLPGGFHGYCFFSLTLANPCRNNANHQSVLLFLKLGVQLFQSSPMMFLLFDIVLPKAVVSQEHSDCEILRTSKDDACSPCGCQRRENRDDSKYGV